MTDENRKGRDWLRRHLWTVLAPLCALGYAATYAAYSDEPGFRHGHQAGALFGLSMMLLFRPTRSEA